MKRLSIPVIISYSIILLTLSSCAVNPVTGRRQLMFMSENQEVRLGAEYDPQIVSAFGLYENEPLLSLMQEKGQEMAAISHRPKLEYHFRILDSPVINAFAVPGGYIYFTRGILAHFNSEAEMIGVLGHEMGHITARHSASRQTQQQLGQILLLGGMIASEEFRRYGEYAMAGMQLLFLSFSREDERESDRLGVEYSSKIGYDATHMANFFQVLERMNLASDHAGIPTFLSTHPDPGDRYGNVLKDVEKWQSELEFDSFDVNVENYLRLVDGMVYGEDPRQGYVDGNMFYHPGLAFQFPFPAGWELENSTIQVRMGPKDRDALMIFTFAQQESLDQAVQATMQQLELNVTDSRRTTVNGMPAIATLSSQTSQDPNTGQQQTLRVLSYFIDDQGTYYVFHGVSAEANFDKYAQAFERTMTSFDKLTDKARLNVQPERVQVRKIQQAGTLAEAFRSLGVPQQRMEELALLNNMQLDERVSAGRLVKVIGK
ncbi:MAG: M48 family metalloprotease [Bacteroidales bacterium]